MRIPRVIGGVIGHRGAAAAPENTLAAIREAAAQGATWVEVDIQITVDSRPILFHDEALDRTTDGTGRVADATFASIRRLDAGSRFAARFAGERVPSFEEALALCRELGLGLNLEIKPAPGREEATMGAVIDALHAAREGAADSLLLSSSDREILALARALAPGLRRGLVLHRSVIGGARTAAALGCWSLHCNHRLLSRQSVARLREDGFEVLAFTVNEPDRAAQLVEWGVRAVFTDFPRTLLERGVMR